MQVTVDVEMHILRQSVAVQIRETDARAIVAGAGENEALSAPGDFCGGGAVGISAASVEPGGDGTVGVDDDVFGAAVTVQVREMDLFSSAADGGGDEALREPVQR